MARLVLALVADKQSLAATYEPDDGRDDWTHERFAKVIGGAFNRQVIAISLPKIVLRLAALGDRLARRQRARLTPDRVAYFCHSDWRVDPAKRPPPHLWQPTVETRFGVKTTLASYREAGWIK